MGILLCEQNFRDVWIRNKSVWAEIGQILRTHTHTTAAKLVVRIALNSILHIGITFRSLKCRLPQPTCLFEVGEKLFKKKKIPTYLP